MSKFTRWSTSILLSGLFSLYAVNSSAQTQLEPLTVTALRGVERGAEQLPLSVTVIDRAQLDQMPGRSLDEVLRQVVGVQLPLNNSAVGFPAIPSIAIRGVGLGDNGTRTLVLLDGRPMNGAFFGNVFWQRMPLQNIERIEIVRGASSSQFGSLAIGGVVNIITRPLPASSGALASVRGGSDETIQADAYLHAALNEQLRLAVNVNYADSDGYFLTRRRDRSPIDARPHSDISNVGVQLEYEVAPATTLYARAAYFSQEQQGATVLSQTDTRLVDISWGLRSQLSERQRLQVNAYYLDEEFANVGTSLRVFGQRDEEFISNIHSTPSEDVGASAVWSLSGDDWLSHWSVGLDYRALDGSDDQDILLRDGSLFLEQLAGGEQRFIGLFTEASLRPLSGLEILPSIRFDRVRLRDGFQRRDDAQERFGNRTIERVNARVALRYQLDSQWSWRGAYHRGFRTPTLAELYRRFGTSTFVGQPNAELREETASGGEVGLDFRQGSFNVQLNAFQTVVKDQIGGVAVGFRPFTLQNQNIGQIRSRGIEWLSEYALDEHWQLDFGYTYTDARIRENRDDAELIGNRVEGAPKHFVSAGLAYRDERFSGHLRGRYLSEQFQDASNETRIPKSTVFDLRLAYRWQPQWELFLQVENLFDNTYTASAFGGLNRIGAPQQFLVGLSWQSR